MKLYESDRYTWTLINLKYDENIGKYYYEFIPKYKGTYYIETHSSKEEIVYGITIQFTEIAGWKMVLPKWKWCKTDRLDLCWWYLVLRRTREWRSSGAGMVK